jgi:transposase
MKEALMRYSTSIGIDTHMKTNQICAIDKKTGVIAEARLSADPQELISWIREQEFTLPIRCCYESGPTGFGLARELNKAGICCVIAATSKLPLRVDKQKNDRVDAEWLARMLDSGAVRPVMIPTLEEESLCHLSRLRGEVASDLRRAKQRVASFLLLTKTSYTLTKKRWTKKFNAWAGSYEFACAADTFTFRIKVASVLRLEERLKEVEGEILKVIASHPELQDRMKRFLALHGIGIVSAFSLVCEVYDFERFKNGAALASYLGLVPSESSTGPKYARGKIAKTGNSHLRRILIEAASCYSRPIKRVKAEDLSVPEPVRAKAEKCKLRLKKRREALKKRGMLANKAKVAVARELAEWIYHIAVMSV